jgi:cellulose synthase (UDP-forming)
MKASKTTAGAHAPAAGTAGLLAHPLVNAALLLLALMLMLVVVAAPLEMEAQMLFCVACLVAALVLRRRANRLTILAMIVLSTIASLRYMYWRLTSSLGFEGPLDMFFGYGLVAAELYALMVLLLGYLQTAWPLRRRPHPLPKDTRQWPTVDLYIPTYNESLEIIKLTALAAQNVDWPKDKLKVYVLDDGRREAFRAFCEEAGIGYITRSDNFHAKAGNLNNALKQTDGEYIAFFDADHVPTRSFLQIGMGWFLKDPKLAMLQTPHFFFSPDPFEKNLDTFRSVPNEGELFYGLVQDGNDLWNATFFCGSCAIIKRAPLEEVGGIAIETVTEDAHTALKLNRLGYTPPTWHCRRPPGWRPKACPVISASAFAGRAAWRRSSVLTIRCWAGASRWVSACATSTPCCTSSTDCRGWCSSPRRWPIWFSMRRSSRRRL